MLFRILDGDGDLKDSLPIEPTPLEFFPQTGNKILHVKECFWRLLHRVGHCLNGLIGHAELLLSALSVSNEELFTQFTALRCGRKPCSVSAGCGHELNSC